MLEYTPGIARSQLVPTEQGYRTRAAFALFNAQSQLVPTEQGYRTLSTPATEIRLSQLVPTEQGYRTGRRHGLLE